MDTQQTEQVFHNMSPKPSAFPVKVFILFLVVILIGLGSGYVLAKYNTSKLPGGSASTTSSFGVVVGATYGTNDTSTFKDTAEGVVQKGGINGEGQYHLVRPGGDSQNVYMTSSTVDLSQFVGRTVKVWGATQTAQYAGWLMDVGKVEVEK